MYQIYQLKYNWYENERLLKMNNKKTLGYKDYIIIEAIFVSRKGRKAGENNQDLFPMGWHSNSNYSVKIEAMFEAVEKGIDLIDTEAYQQIIEGIRLK